jgi:aspartate/methionine/tyrosine aminotransferase
MTQSLVRAFETMALIPEIEARRAQGLPLFRFDVGEPAVPPPAQALAATAHAVLNEPMPYTESKGREALRRRISRWYKDTYDVDVDPERIIVTLGASAGLTLAVTAAFEHGEAVAIPRPGYPAYRNIVNVLNRKAVEVRCGYEEGFRFTADVLDKIEEPVKGAIFASPANPTGVVMSAAEVAELVEHARARGMTLISDEIYQGLVYDKEDGTAAGFEDVYVVSSFSKLWRMTGWRVGWVVAPASEVARVTLLAQALFLSPSTPGQIMALHALDHTAECLDLVDRYRRNRDVVMDALRSVGIERIAPADGAFYVYADFSAYTDDSLAFSKRLLREAGVTVATGVDFDSVDGKNWVRFCTAGAEDEVKAGMVAFTTWLKAQDAKKVA